MSSLDTLFSLQARVALITGASRGIGFAVARIFGAAGARLALVARDAARLEQAAEQLRGQGYTVLACACDVSAETEVNSAVASVRAQFGRIDILVNNAGILQAGHITDFSAADWERMIAVNLNSAFYLSRAVAPLMIEQKSGRILNISSLTAQTGGVSGSVQYAASKGALLSFTKTLARDLAPHHITVNAIAPGQIETDMGALSDEARARIVGMIPLGRLGTPEDIAYAALFLASDAASYITGATIDVNGGILKR
ncbi:MAG: 3-oxoacyl-ACP reductase FabG [Anaerolineae bacterium]|nr:3-oxoacyl-ACP reductase FabG [Anaerolineae bacterium]